MGRWRADYHEQIENFAAAVPAHGDEALGAATIFGRQNKPRLSPRAVRETLDELAAFGDIEVQLRNGWRRVYRWRP